MRGWILLVLITASLAGCLSSESGDSLLFDTSPQGTATPEERSSPTESATDVMVTMENGRYRAEQTHTYTNGFAGSMSFRIDLDGFNGGQILRGEDVSRYELVRETYATGETEQEAREALEAMVRTFDDRMEDNVQVIASAAYFEPGVGPGGPSICIVACAQASVYQGGANFVMTVPTRIASDFDLESSNGGLVLAGLQGQRASLETSNGGATVGGQFQDLDVDTSNGVVAVDGNFGDVRLHTSNAGVSVDGSVAGDLDVSTSNAAIHFDLLRSSSGEARWVFDTSNGGISGEFAGSSWDITADTSNAGIQVNVQDGEQLDDDPVRVRSNNWSSADTRTTVALDTSNAGISVDAVY